MCAAGNDRETPDESGGMSREYVFTGTGVSDRMGAESMILLIDNYDSFSYNLYQLVGELNPDLKVIRNDECTVEEIRAMKPEAIILSPGPGRPADAGVCIAVVKALAGEIPILGVCLGHQAICEAYGGTVSYAKRMMHGKTSVAALDTESPIFAEIGSTMQVARYHSLAALEETLPQELRITARTEDGEVMAVEHREKSVYGLQFHPESVLTPQGKNVLKNFLEVAKHD